MAEHSRVKGKQINEQPLLIKLLCHDDFNMLKYVKVGTPCILHTVDEHGTEKQVYDPLIPVERWLPEDDERAAVELLLGPNFTTEAIAKSRASHEEVTARVFNTTAEAWRKQHPHFEGVAFMYTVLLGKGLEAIMRGKFVDVEFSKGELSPYTRLERTVPYPMYYAFRNDSGGTFTVLVESPDQDAPPFVYQPAEGQVIHVGANVRHVLQTAEMPMSYGVATDSVAHPKRTDIVTPLMMSAGG